MRSSLLKPILLSGTLMVAAAASFLLVAQTPAPAAKAAPKAATTKANSTPAKAAPAAKSTAAKSTAAKSTLNLLNPASLKEKAPGIYVVKLETTKGNVVIRVTKLWAPQGAERFYNLVKAGFYDNCYFFRSLDFMVQAGISSKAEINRVWADKNLQDDRRIETNIRGRVTYANTGEPNSRGTQIFINKLDVNRRLDSAPSPFVPFGEVVEGMDVVDKIYTGYEGNVSQQLFTNQGEAYLNRNFPRLDKIIKATIIATP
ncbi:MAG: peptidylprolyl isomerase [Acidobacteriota bacterium]